MLNKCARMSTPVSECKIVKTVLFFLTLEEVFCGAVFVKLLVVPQCPCVPTTSFTMMYNVLNWRKSFSGVKWLVSAQFTASENVACNSAFQATGGWF